MAKKRERLEIVRDILKAIRSSKNRIKPTRLLYSSNLSPQMFKDYVEELLGKGFIKENIEKDGKKTFSLMQKGHDFIDEYKVIERFIEGFGL